MSYTVTAEDASTQPYVVTVTVAYNIGDTGPAGGFVFYDKGSYSDGWRYLEAAPSDQSTGTKWDNGSFSTTGATAIAVGTGHANTTTIVSSQGAGSYAAKLCDDLNIDIYSDWFLPSKDELNQMYENLKEHGVGGFAEDEYWSSSEVNDNFAWGQDFTNSTQKSNTNKNLNRWVRAVRSF